MGRTEDDGNRLRLRCRRGPARRLDQHLPDPRRAPGCKINFLDMPGYRDFVGEIRNSLARGRRRGYRRRRRGQRRGGNRTRLGVCRGVPACRVLFVINKPSTANGPASTACSTQSRETFGMPPVLVNFPHGEAARLQGLRQPAQDEDVRPGERRQDGSSCDIPAECAERRCRDSQSALMETAAEGDDALTEKFLDGAGTLRRRGAQGPRGSPGAAPFLPSHRHRRHGGRRAST